MIFWNPRQLSVLGKTQYIYNRYGSYMQDTLLYYVLYACKCKHNLRIICTMYQISLLDQILYIISSLFKISLAPDPIVFLVVCPEHPLASPLHISQLLYEHLRHCLYLIPTPHRIPVANASFYEDPVVQTIGLHPRASGSKSINHHTSDLVRLEIHPQLTNPGYPWVGFPFFFMSKKHLYWRENGNPPPAPT